MIRRCRCELDEVQYQSRMYLRQLTITPTTRSRVGIRSDRLEATVPSAPLQYFLVSSSRVLRLVCAMHTLHVRMMDHRTTANGACAYALYLLHHR